jgi:tetratricopeptide (TPR) repeat protein
LPASQFYSEALRATESPNLIQVRLDILIRKAFRYSRGQEVEANASYEEAFALIQSMPSPPGYLAQLLRDFADLQVRMGNPEGAAKLLARAASAPSYVPVPYPRFGMQDMPEAPVSTSYPVVSTLVAELWRLLRDGQYKRAGVAADRVFAFIEDLPQWERHSEDAHFESIALAYARSGRKSEATAVLEREIAVSEKFGGSAHYAFARTLDSVAWIYMDELQILPPVHQLIERAARIVSISDGENSDAMASIENIRVRLAQWEGDSETAAKAKARIQEIWNAVHGANTVRQTIACHCPSTRSHG